jgi:hypothetical protein
MQQIEMTIVFIISPQTKNTNGLIYRAQFCPHVGGRQEDP